MNQIGMKPSIGGDILAELKSLQDQVRKDSESAKGQKQEGSSFLDHLSSTVDDVNAQQINADRMATDVASGKNQNLHEVMLATTQAELSFKMMVQVRNKVLEAYQEVMRMPV